MSDSNSHSESKVGPKYIPFSNLSLAHLCKLLLQAYCVNTLETEISSWTDPLLQDAVFQLKIQKPN